MGLVTWLLRKVRPPRLGAALALGFSVGKLTFRCLQTGWKPLLLGEKIGLWVLDRKNGRLVLAYIIVRVTVARQRCTQVVERTLSLVGDPLEIEAEGLTLGDVASAVSTLQAQQSEGQEQHMAAFMFCELMLSKRAVDAHITSMYAMPRGRFDVYTCLKDYYSSPLQSDFRKAVRAGQKSGCQDKERLERLRVRIWDDVRTRSRNDAIDFFLL